MFNISCMLVYWITEALIHDMVTNRRQRFWLWGNSVLNSSISRPHCASLQNKNDNFARQSKNWNDSVSTEQQSFFFFFFLPRCNGKDWASWMRITFLCIVCVYYICVDLWPVNTDLTHFNTHTIPWVTECDGLQGESKPPVQSCADVVAAELIHICYGSWFAFPLIWLMIWFEGSPVCGCILHTLNRSSLLG